MNCLRSLLLVLICLLPGVCHAVDYFLVTGDDVNVRKGPGLQWKVVANVDLDQLVLETRREDQWSEISFLTADKKVISGWIFNSYLSSQRPEVVTEKVATPELEVNVTVDPLVCSDQSVVTIGSLCYLDMYFDIQAGEAVSKEVEVVCQAEFVVPGEKGIVPIQTTGKQIYHLLGGRAEGIMRLNVGLDARVDRGKHDLAYYNCSAK